MSQNITKTSVALTQIDRRIVEKLAKEKGLNFSSALRVIVREWDELRKYVLQPTSPVGK